MDAGSTAWTCPTGPFGSPIPSGATLTRVAGVPPPDPTGTIDMMGNGYSTVEGPVWAGTALYVSEFGNMAEPISRIIQVTPSGMVSVPGPSGWNPGSNGLAIDKSGVLYGAIHLDGSISRLDPSTGTRTPIATGYGTPSKRFNSPNDLAIRSDGTIYFSDPNFQEPTMEQPVTGLYRISPGTNAVSMVDSTLTNPNGVTLSLDENTLYVSSATMGGIITKYPVMADGSTGTGTTFVQTIQLSRGKVAASIDGMALDCAGNLYGAVIANGSPASVVVLDPTGAVIGELPVPGVASATNTAFGGADHKTLYVSAQGSSFANSGASQAQGLYQVQLSIPGMPY
jgi:gluconolactonase